MVGREHPSISHKNLVVVFIELLGFIKLIIQRNSVGEIVDCSKNRNSQGAQNQLPSQKDRRFVRILRHPDNESSQDVPQSIFFVAQELTEYRCK